MRMHQCQHAHTHTHTHTHTLFAPACRPGTLTLTGQVGEVLEESAQIALSWIRAHAYELQLDMPRGRDAGAAGAHPRGQPEGGRAEGHGTNCTDSRAMDARLPCTRPGAHLATQLGAEVVPKHAARVELLNPASCWDLHLHLPAGAIPKVRLPAMRVRPAQTACSRLRAVRQGTMWTYRYSAVCPCMAPPFLEELWRGASWPARASTHGVACSRCVEDTPRAASPLLALKKGCVCVCK